MPLAIRFSTIAAKPCDVVGHFGAKVAADSVQTLSNAEAVSIQGLSGKAQTREVVDAVMQADQTLQTAIAIRDKIVTAYLELSRMSI